MRYKLNNVKCSRFESKVDVVMDDVVRLNDTQYRIIGTEFVLKESPTESLLPKVVDYILLYWRRVVFEEEGKGYLLAKGWIEDTSTEKGKFRPCNNLWTYRPHSFSLEDALTLQRILERK